MRISISASTFCGTEEHATAEGWCKLSFNAFIADSNKFKTATLYIRTYKPTTNRNWLNNFFDFGINKNKIRR